MATRTFQYITTVITIYLFYIVFLDFAAGQSNDLVVAANALRIFQFVIPVIVVIVVCIVGGVVCYCRRKRLAAQRTAQQQALGGMSPPAGQINGAYTMAYPTEGQEMTGYSQPSHYTWGQPYVVQPPTDNKNESSTPPAYTELYPAPPAYPSTARFPESASNPSVK